MTASKRYVDNVRVPSSFVYRQFIVKICIILNTKYHSNSLDYRMAFVRPKLRSMAKIKTAKWVEMEAHQPQNQRQKRDKELVHRTKSITHQILSLRLSEIYQPADDGDKRRKSNSNPDRPSICQDYGSNDSDYGSEYRNGHCGGGHKLVGTHGRSAMRWSNTNGNLLGGELALLQGEQQQNEGGGGGGGDEERGSNECWGNSRRSV